MEHISGNALVIKKININLVRKVLQEKGLSTKQQIAKATGLSLVTVGTVLQQLLKQNEVFESELSPSNGGRPAQQFLYNYDYAHALVIFPYESNESIFIHSVIVNMAGKCVTEAVEKVDFIDLKCFEQQIQPLLNAYPTIRVIGFGLPGVEENGKIIVSDYKMLIGTSFTEHFSKLYKLPVIIENDVNAAVIGFAKGENTVADNTLIYIYFPDQHPPGAGIIINGKLFKGKSNFAGEISTIPLDITWNDRLYSSFNELCTAISDLVVTLCSILNPDKIVLNGNFLKAEHLSNIVQESSSRLPRNIVPEISLSGNFVSDYQSGLIVQTLELLEPDIRLTRKKYLEV